MKKRISGSGKSFKRRTSRRREILHGVKTSNVQAVGAHTKEELMGMLVMCVVNFPPKHIGLFTSEVLTLDFKNAEGDGWILATPAKKSVEIGDRLR